MPVVDSRLYQVVYHGRGVLWETSYIDTEMREDILSCYYQNKSTRDWVFFSASGKKDLCSVFGANYSSEFIHIPRLASSPIFIVEMFVLVVVIHFWLRVTRPGRKAFLFWICLWRFHLIHSRWWLQFVNLNKTHCLQANQTATWGKAMGRVSCVWSPTFTCLARSHETR